MTYCHQLVKFFFLFFESLGYYKNPSKFLFTKGGLSNRSKIFSATARFLKEQCLMLQNTLQKKQLLS